MVAIRAADLSPIKEKYRAETVLSLAIDRRLTPQMHTHLLPSSKLAFRMAVEINLRLFSPTTRTSFMKIVLRVTSPLYTATPYTGRPVSKLCWSAKPAVVKHR